MKKFLTAFAGIAAAFASNASTPATNIAASTSIEHYLK